MAVWEDRIEPCLREAPHRATLLRKRRRVPLLRSKAFGRLMHTGFCVAVLTLAADCIVGVGLMVTQDRNGAVWTGFAAGLFVAWAAGLLRRMAPK